MKLQAATLLAIIMLPTSALADANDKCIQFNLNWKLVDAGVLQSAVKSPYTDVIRGRLTLSNDSDGDQNIFFQFEGAGCSTIAYKDKALALICSATSAQEPDVHGYWLISKIPKEEIKAEYCVSGK